MGEIIEEEYDVAIEKMVESWAEEYERRFGKGSIKAREQNLNKLNTLAGKAKKQGWSSNCRARYLADFIDLLIKLEEHALANLKSPQSESSETESSETESSKTESSKTESSQS